MTETDDAILDPVLMAAVERVRAEARKAEKRWRPADEEEEEMAEEAAGQAKAALRALEAGLWDEAETLGQGVVELDELHGSGEAWREFAILVEEACAIGREG